jgi:hypothetical protein
MCRCHYLKSKVGEWERHDTARDGWDLQLLQVSKVESAGRVPVWDLGSGEDGC